MCLSLVRRGWSHPDHLKAKQKGEFFLLPPAFHNPCAMSLKPVSAQTRDTPVNRHKGLAKRKETGK